MRKTHLAYLKRAIGLAASLEDKSALLPQLEAMKGASGPVCQLVRDIVCDSRFYGVIDKGVFWKEYCVAAVSGLIDHLESAGLMEERAATENKEDFLNSWLSDHVIPFSEIEQKRIEGKLREMKAGGGLMFDTPASGLSRNKSNAFTYGFGVKDKTETDEELRPDLPEEAKPLLEGSDDAMSGLKSEWKQMENEYLRLMDPALLEMARKIGRSGGSVAQSKGRFSHASKSDITGIMAGNDLNRMLPSETVLLTSTDTEKIFMRRFVEKRLQIFSSSSSSLRPEVRGKGPVYICIDTSGSMTGEPELMAKNLALCITIIAQRERRPVFLVNYSHTLSFFVVTDLRQQRKRFLTFLSQSYSGGNDEEKLFRFLFGVLPSSPSYSQYVSTFKGADLLIVSDFQWNRVEEETKNLIDTVRARGMKIHALGVSMTHGKNYSVNISRESGPNNPGTVFGGGMTRRGGNIKAGGRSNNGNGNNGIADDSWQEGNSYRNGYDFYGDADYRYTYSGNRLREEL